MLAILGREIRDFDYSTIDDPGFERMRRLTHAEYDRTVRDLFGVDLNPTDRFPDEVTRAVDQYGAGRASREAE